MILNFLTVAVNYLRVHKLKLSQEVDSSSLTVDRTRVSGRAAVNIANAALEDMGLISEGNKETLLIFEI